MLNDILNEDLDPIETREWTDALGVVIGVCSLRERNYQKTYQLSHYRQLNYFRHVSAQSCARSVGPSF